MSEIRVDLLHNKQTIIAPERLHRPDFYEKTSTPKDEKQNCPFCDGNESMTPDEIFAIRENEPNSRGWKTRVVPNLYKAVQVELQNSSKRDGMFESFQGVGAHEVLIDSPNHNEDIVTLSTNHIELWLNTITKRVVDLKQDTRLINLSVFKNYGQNSGATQKHPHTQLLALPLMPKDELDFLKHNFKYFQKHGRGIVQDMVENEKNSKLRVIEESESFLAYAPFASSFPFEVIVAPLSNIPSISDCNEKEIENLAFVIKNVFAKLHEHLGEFDYNFYFRLPPINKNFENKTYISSIKESYRFYLRIIPRIYRLGGFELSTNIEINPVSPEDCATLLNQKRDLK